jgi:chromosome partitioning protein
MAELVAFYSYKGGVGRSVTLANVAVMLARRGSRVVCVDFDLEAAGLHTIFGIEPSDISVSLLDLLRDPRDAGEALIELTSRLGPKTAGKLYVLPNITNFEKLPEILLFADDLSGRMGQILTEIENMLLPNFILIDSRTGFAELSAIAVTRAAHLACLLRPNRQNVDGIRELLDVIETAAEKDCLLILTQIPDIPEAEKRIQQLEQLLGKESRHFDVRIPYFPELALDETVIALTQPGSPLVCAYEPIVNWLWAMQK